MYDVPVKVTLFPTATRMKSYDPVRTIRGLVLHGLPSAAQDLSLDQKDSA